MKNFSTTQLWVWTKRLLPVVIGATAGYAYYHFIGCVSGSCPITSNPWSSTGYGALLGFLFTSWPKKKHVAEKEV